MGFFTLHLTAWRWGGQLWKRCPGGAERWRGAFPEGVHIRRHLRGPSLPFVWRQFIPTCTQRPSSAERPKWQRSSWPRRLSPAEWSSLCPHGHRGLAQLTCFLRGHLAGLCSYPGNAGTGISTWFGSGLVIESGNIADKLI